MIQCTIMIDHRGYCGEDPDRTYKPGYGEQWYTYVGDERHLPRYGPPQDAKIIEGTRGLRAHLERIIRWIADEQIEPKQIVINITY